MLRERTPIPVQEARERIDRHIRLMGTEEVPLEEAEGRFLAAALIADEAVPPFDRSGMDGYAIRAQDTMGAAPNNPVILKVVDAIGAGSLSHHHLQEGEAIRIMTGTQIPAGADAVVMLEKTEPFTQQGDPYIKVYQEMKVGEDLSYRGDDIKEGERLIGVGKRIGPGDIALFATYRWANVKVFQKPKVGILATGTELVPVGEPLVPGKIRNSNSAMLGAQVKRLGGMPIQFGIASDRMEELKERIEQIFPQVDLLITTGGVSVGDYDFMYEIYQSMEAEVLFDKPLMRPGKTTTVAVKEEKLLFGLSGNPGAAFVGFELFVRPLLLKMVGVPAEKAILPSARAIMDEDFKKPSAFPKYLRARYRYDGDRLHVSLAGSDQSSLVLTIQRANCLALIPAGGRGVAKGSEVEIFFLDRCDGF